MSDLSNISEVYTANNKVDTNKYLALNWKLLKVIQIANEDCSKPEFVLGWPKEQGKPQHPESEFETV